MSLEQSMDWTEPQVRTTAESNNLFWVLLAVKNLGFLGLVMGNGWNKVVLMCIVGLTDIESK